MNKNRLMRLLFLFVAGLIGQTVIAQTNNYTPIFCESQRGGIVANLELVTQSDKFPDAVPPVNTNWHDDFRMVESIGRVSLEVDPEDNTCLPDTFTCEVVLDITYYKWDNSTATVRTTLKITYNKGQGKSYKEKDFYQLADVHYVKAKVVSISNSSVANYLVLRNEIQQERYKDFTTSSAPVVVAITPTSNNELKIDFFTLPAVVATAVEYDVEWTFVESYKSNGTLENGGFTYDFRFNSSRVTLSKVSGASFSWTLQNVYDKGVLLVRVRAVGKGGINNDQRIEGNWSRATSGSWAASSGTLPADAYFVSTEFNAKLNWQYACSFAEEGKRSESISYFDGSLRSRQSQQLILGEGIQGQNYIVVTDQIYDYEGRQAIQTLPAPVDQGGFGYIVNSVKNIDNTAEYKKEHFDKDQTFCSNISPAIGTLSLSEQYYSASNAWVTASSDMTNMAQYLPQSLGYSFVQTEFTPDNTGRVSRTSGAGPNHFLGSGHETKYTYVTPNQVELDMVFGSEAGYAEHYKKNTVIDANGQKSVSYLNLAGKVVATALSGPKPASVSGIIPETFPKISVGIENDNYSVVDESVLQSTHTFDVSKASDFEFLYEVNAAKYLPQICNENNTTICFDGVYRLQISLINDCGNQKFTGNGSTEPEILIDRIIGSTADASGVAQCNTPAARYAFATDSYLGSPSDGFIKKTLQPGTYRLIKKLIIDDKTIDTYAKKYLEVNPLCKTLADFETEALAAIDTTWCNMTCEKCNEQLGTEIDFRARKVADLTAQGVLIITEDDETNIHHEYLARKASCDELCVDNFGMCDAIEESLKGDVSPGGQYALYTASTEVPGTFVLVDATYNLMMDDALNTMSYKSVVTYPEFNDINQYKVMIGGVAKKVNELTITQFINNFDPAWAKLLVRSHPEYCKLEKCRSTGMVNSGTYDTSMLSAETYDDAKASTNSLLNPFGTYPVSYPLPTSYDANLIKDPAFMTTGCLSSVGAADMWNRLKVYKTVPFTSNYLTDDDGEKIVLNTLTASGVVIYVNAKNNEYIGRTCTGNSSKLCKVNATGAYVLDGSAEIELGTINAIGTPVTHYDITLNTPFSQNYEFSMWDIPIMTYFCSGMKNGKGVYNCVVRNRSKVESCAGVEDKYWAMFRALYQANKNYLMGQSSTCSCNNPWIPSGKIRRLYTDGTNDLFGTDPQTYNPTETEINAKYADIRGNITSHCIDQCNQYADHWMEKLKGCGFASESEKGAIRAALIDVCKYGCDENHPFGSSTVSPANALIASNKSFKDVLEKALGRSIFVEQICDDILISWPKSYIHDYFATENPYSDTCACKVNPPAPETGCPCEEVMQQADSRAAILIGSSVATEEKKCKTCVSCLQVRNAYQEFYNTYITLELADEKFNSLFEQFLNNRLGFNLTHSEYYGFMSQCVGDDSIEKTKAILIPFREYYGIILQGQSIGYSAPSIKQPELIQVDQPMYAMNVQDGNPTQHAIFNGLSINPNSLANRFANYAETLSARNNELDKTYGANLTASVDENNFASRTYHQGLTKLDNAFVNKVNAINVEEEGGDNPNGAGLDKCGCNALFDVFSGFPSTVAGQANAAALFKIRYSLPMMSDEEIINMAKICCKSANGVVPYSPGITSEGNTPCTITVETKANWSQSSDEALTANMALSGNAGYKLPAVFRCPPNTCIKQVDMCGCDKLIKYESDFEVDDEGFDGNLLGYINYKMGSSLGLTPEKLAAMLSACKSAKGSAWTESGIRLLKEEIWMFLPASLSCYPESCTSNPYPRCKEIKHTNCSTLVAQIQSQYHTLTQDFITNLHPTDFEGQSQSSTFINNVNTIADYLNSLYNINTSSICDVVVRIKHGEVNCESNGGFNRNGEDAEMDLEPRYPYGTTYPIPANTPRTIGFDYNSIRDILNFCGCYGVSGGCLTCPENPNEPRRPWNPELYVDKVCDSCYTPVKEMQFLKKFFNDIASATHATITLGSGSIPIVLNKFHDLTEWNIHTAGYSSYYGTSLYGGTNPSDVTFKRTDIATYYGNQYKMTIKDLSSHLRNIVITLPSNAQDIGARFSSIRKFMNIRPFCTEAKHHFLVDVEVDIYDPYNWKTGAGIPPQKVVMTALVYVDDIEVTQTFNCNLKLCNRTITIKIPKEDCAKQLKNMARLNAANEYNKYIENVKLDFKARYIKACRNAQEVFKLRYDHDQYHYTLYYYDAAGNLVSTVPPEGVHFVTDATKLSNIGAARNAGNRSSDDPVHTMVTTYQYNSIGELVSQQTPDAGVSNFYYDELGRLIFSQNAKQQPANKYSYTLFDALGRITEVGQLQASSSNVMTHGKSRVPSDVTGFMNPILAAGAFEQVTKTFYDDKLNISTGTNGVLPTGIPNSMDNTRNRVVASTFHSNRTTAAETGVFYSYDIHGNVKTIIRYDRSLEFINHAIKTVDYDYDLISGKVNQVTYQANEADQYIHVYKYDKINRLREALSGTRMELLERDAKYIYYPHGALARTELGAKKVQGLDYAYTIQGWLKGVNSATLEPGRDMGKDGLAGTSPVSLHINFPRDEYGFTLHYFDGDYSSVSTIVNGSQFALLSGGVNLPEGNLYNGNIKMMVTGIEKLMDEVHKPLASGYVYDQLNRIKVATYYNDFNTNNTWASNTALNDWKNTFIYDANGNIKHQTRNGSTAKGLTMDDLTYNYISGTNKLDNVGDVSSTYLDDIDGQSSGNYQYDAIGNLIHDEAEQIDEITWNVYGKITKIKRLAGSEKPDLEFAYSPDGHRVLKVVIPKQPDEYKHYTYYVRDAQGNILATYERSLKRIVDFNRLQYAAVNQAFVDELGLYGFADFITKTSNTTNLKAHLLTNLNTDETFLRTFNPSYLLTNHGTAFNDMLTHVSDLDYVTTLLNNEYPDYGSLYDCYNNRNTANHNFYDFKDAMMHNPDFLAILFNHPEFDQTGLLSDYGVSTVNDVIDYLFDTGVDVATRNERYDLLLNRIEASRYKDFNNWHNFLRLFEYMQEQSIPLTFLSKMQGIRDILYNTSESYECDLTSSKGNVINLFSNNPDMVWTSLLQAHNVTYWLTALHDIDPDFLFKAAFYSPAKVSTYQQANNMYSASGNGMEAYFMQLRDKTNQVAYDHVMEEFYNVSRTYSEKLKVNEWMIYGSSRLGVQKARLDLYSTTFDADVENNIITNKSELQEYDAEYAFHSFAGYRGRRQYELSNHLGNVLAVVSDKKTYNCTTTGVYTADVIQANDYSPFGAPMPDRSWSPSMLFYNRFEASGNTLGWTAYSGGPVLSIDAGRLKATASGNCAVQKAVTLEQGALYELVVDVDAGTYANMKIEVREDASTTYALVKDFTTTVNGQQVIEFKATRPQMYLRLIFQGTGTKIGYVEGVMLLKKSSNKHTTSTISDPIVTVTTRTTNIPVYIATESITFETGFESATNDEFETIIEQIIVVNNGSDEDDYRFGFNGVERDDEVVGAGNMYAFEYRIHDARLGRFLSIDPLTKEFPWNTPYSFAESSPILFIDNLGLSKSTRYVGEDGKELANTNDGNNSTVVVKNDQRERFDMFLNIGKQTGKTDDRGYNMFMISEITPANQGLYFTNKDFGIDYMRYLHGKTESKSRPFGQEVFGYSTQDGGMVVLPRQGVNMFGKEFENGGFESDPTALPMKGNIISLGGQNYTVKASYHTHPNNSTFSGFPTPFKLGGKTHMLMLEEGDAQAYMSSFFTKTNKVTDHYVIGKTVMHNIHFNISKGAFTNRKENIKR